MKIEHLALWVNDLEKTKAFYVQYFSAKAGEKYFNPVKQFESYFLSFEEGTRLEIMRKPDIKLIDKSIHEYMGLSHFAVSVGSKERVDQLTSQLRNDGFSIHSEPRTTGDGYYESVVLDPEGNRIEITI